jgi:superoxide dismutase, Fe-Mn family
MRAAADGLPEIAPAVQVADNIPIFRFQSDAAARDNMRAMRGRHSPKLRCLRPMEPSIRVPVKPNLPSQFSHHCGHHPMTFTLPNLPYAHDALAPHMSKETLEYHHDKHHQAYVTNGNNAIKGTEFEGKSLEEIVKGSFGKNPAVFNNAGQHYNHTHFWNWMKPNGGGSKLPGRLEKKITEDLGGLEKFKTDFAAAGVGQFGSGWAWLSVKNGKLEISKTPNGESPLVHGATPILGVDVWEHSYYIDYRNRRPDYLKAFVDHLVNWEYVDQLFSKA